MNKYRGQIGISYIFPLISVLFQDNLTNLIWTKWMFIIFGFASQYKINESVDGHRSQSDWSMHPNVWPFVWSVNKVVNMHPNRLHYDYRIDREQTSQFVLFLQVFLFRFCFLYIFIHSSRSVASSLTLCVLLFAYGGVKHTGLKKKEKEVRGPRFASLPASRKTEWRWRTSGLLALEPCRIRADLSENTSTRTHIDG